MQDMTLAWLRPPMPPLSCARAIGAVYEPMTFGGYQNLVAQQNKTTQQRGVWGRTGKWRMWIRPVQY
jgi:hypothetical protein